MKFLICLCVMLAACSAEEEKKTEKRGVLGLGYGGLGYAGLPAAYPGHLGGYPGYGAYPYSAPLGYSHGLGLPYSGLPLAHGYSAPALHAPYVAKAVAPVGYAAPLHAPYVAKTIAPVSHFGYSSPYFGLGHGLYH